MPIPTVETAESPATIPIKPPDIVVINIDINYIYYLIFLFIIKLIICDNFLIICNFLKKKYYFL